MKSPPVRYRVNVRFVAVLLAVVAVAGGGLYAVHKRQAGRQTAVFLEQADAAEAAGDADKAADYLGRYLVNAPGDHAARGRLGLLLVKQASAQGSGKGMQRAYLVLDEAVRGLPDRTDLRRKAAEVALLFPDLLGDAQMHLDKLIQADPADGRLEALAAVGLVKQADYARAVERLERAVQKTPDLFDATLDRAVLLRDRLGRGEEADKLVEAMAAANPRSAPAQLAAAEYWRESTRRDRAERQAAAVAAARTAAPDDPAVAAAAAREARAAAGRPDGVAGLAAAQAGLAAAIDRLSVGVTRVEPAELAKLDPDARLRRAQLAALFTEAVETAVVAAGLPGAAGPAGDRLAAAEAVARRGADLMPEAFDLQVALVGVLVGRQQSDAAGRELDRLEKLRPADPRLAYFRGRLLIARGEWREAAGVLDGVVSAADPTGDLGARAALLAGGCWDKLGGSDRRLAAYRRAAAADPRSPVWAEANLRLAAVLTETDQLAEATRVYEKLRAAKVAEAALPLARLLTVDTLQRPAVGRDWGRVEAVLQDVPDGPGAAVLRAELEVYKGDPAAARARLAAAAAKYPDDPVVSLARAELEAGDPAKAKELLAAFEAKHGRTVDLRLLEARLAAKPGADVRATVERAVAGAERLPPEEARRLLRGLKALVPSAAGGPAPALGAVAERLAPNDLVALSIRLDEALARKDLAAADALVDQMRAADGADGPAAKAARAAVLIARAEGGDKAGLAEAEELLAAVQGLRPGSPRPVAARGRVADLRGDRAVAVARYREAVDAGDRQPQVLVRLVELYYHQGQFRDAQEVLGKLTQTGRAAGGLMVAELAARSGDTARALEAAAQAVPEDSTDPNRLLWLAYLRQAAKAPADQIERPIRRAVQLAPADPAMRSALVQHLVATGRKAEAVEAVKAAEREVRGPNRAVGLAECYTMTGEVGKAVELYAAAAADPAATPLTLRLAADFLLRANAPDKAEAISRRLLAAPAASAEDKQAATRMLAVLATARQDYASSRGELERLGLLDRGQPTRLTGAETPAELRTRAEALGVQPDARLRRAAAEALEALDQRQPLTPDAEFLLARLYMGVGDWAKARPRLARLAFAADANLFHTAVYGAGLLRFDGDAAEARRCLEVLQKAQPDTPRTVELHAAVLDAEGKPAEAAAAALKFAGDDPARAGVAAAVLDRLGLGDRAEPLVRKLAADPKRPQAALALAAFLGRQGKTRDALGVLRDRGAKLPPVLLAQVGVEVLYNAPAVDPADVRAVEGMLEAAKAAGAKPADLLTLTGVLRMAEGKYPEAVAAYREVVGRGGPPDPVALNNLGYLLAVHAGRPDEGLELVRQAKRAAGPQGWILDTEAVVLTRKGEADKAVELLAEVVRDTAEPAALVHLAQAYRAAGNTAAADEVTRQARRRKVRAIDLPPPERAGLREVLAGRG